MDFRTFVRTIMFRWKIVVAAILACLIGAAAITAAQAKTYQASAMIFMTLSGAASVTDVNAATEASQQALSSYAEIAGSRTVAERAIGQLNLAMSADQLVDNTEVTYTPESLLFRITVNDSDKLRVAALAGAMADQFAAYVPEVEPTVGGDHPAPFAYAVVVERPTVAESPVSPVPTRNLSLGLLAGILLGIASALIRDRLDRRVRTRETLERAAGVPTLGELPKRKGNRAMRAEAVRVLRARLTAPGGPNPLSVLLTAPTPGDGATTSALDLALTFTEIGERVVLVEGDTRLPVIARLLAVESTVGLADVMTNSVDVDDAITPTAHADLSMLASTAATEADRHFGAAALRRTMEKLCAGFERVVVDGPPALATTDAAMLAGAVEATVLIVRAGKSTTDEVTAAVAALRSAGGNVVGTVLTDASVPRYVKAASQAYQAKVTEAP